ncbi:hypothetical protein [Massilia niastensis]|uniref:hypothetical protein n=1 Tax=Massilia niastensis TaxID=544911 RepID=UPI0012EC236E|nr:hypothetical protein [Massilia niastensis]
MLTGLDEMVVQHPAGASLQGVFHWAVLAGALPHQDAISTIFFPLGTIICRRLAFLCFSDELIYGPQSFLARNDIASALSIQKAILHRPTVALAAIQIFRKSWISGLHISEIHGFPAIFFPEVTNSGHSFFHQSQV